MKAIVSLICVFLCAPLPVIALGATTYVPDNYATIQDAINDSINGDTIIVRPGTYYETIDFIGRAITLKSESGPEVTIIDGGQTGSVVTFQSGEDLDSVLDGFTLTNGSGTPSGNNTHGGGIYCKSSSPIITSNIISGNSATRDGGGIYCSYASLTITNNSITNNSAYYGGGIYCEKLYPTIINNTISNNSATLCGGGINCFYDAHPTIINSIISNNVSISNGGGITCHDSPTTIIHCTVVGNTTGNLGGGFKSHHSYPIITNTIFWDNQAPDTPEISIDTNCTVTYCDIKGGYTGKGNIELDPLFIDPANGDFHLQQDPPQAGYPDSPCVNAGYPGDPSFVDGSTRTDGVPDVWPVDVGYHYPAADFTLSVDPMLLVPGQNAVFTVSCGVPSTMTYLVYSLTGTGSVYVPMLDVTLGVLNPKLLDSGFALGNGEVEWTLPVPSNAPSNLTVLFQVCQERKASDVVQATVQ